MSKDAVHFLMLHLMGLVLFAGCLLLAGHKNDGSEMLYAVLAGVLSVVVLGTLKDFYAQVKADLARQ